MELIIAPVVLVVIFIGFGVRDVLKAIADDADNVDWEDESQWGDQ